MVGIAGYAGGRDSLAGETTVFFTEPVAQELMLGQPDVFSVIDVKVADGTSFTEARDRIATAMGLGYEVKTGEQLAEESAEGVKTFFQFFNYLLLGFAGVALFVGIFIILNTFSIIVAQRTQELALFRAMGASRGQMIGSVLLEAVVIGLIASLIGLLFGIGIGAGLGSFLGSFLSGGALELAGFAVPPAAIIASFVVGVGVTVLAALLPAMRASRIPPVAAMREAATPDRPLTRLSVLGAIVLAVGGTALGLGLAGELGDANLWAVLGGLLTCFVGVALLTPLISRPVVRALGWLFRWSAPGQLGRGNSARNPRRTAITAAALMVSIALVTGISVVFASIRESTVKAVDTGVNAELVVAADPLQRRDRRHRSRGRAPDPRALGRGLGGRLSTATWAVSNGTDEFVGAVDDIAALAPMFELKATAGDISVAAREWTCSSTRARPRTAACPPADTVTVELGRGEPQTLHGDRHLRAHDLLLRRYLLPEAAATSGFRSPAPLQAFVSLAPGADETALENQVAELLRNSPEVSVSNLDDYVAQQAQIFDFVLIFVQLLLLLAMIIAVLGIINTLALSMIERTRELGLLRAVGMKRRQVMWMVTVESVVISVFGALLGIAVGAGLGAAVFQALREQGFTDLAFPWPLMVFYVSRRSEWASSRR